MDGNAEKRTGTTSVFNGPVPVIRAFGTPEHEAQGVGAWLKDRVTGDRLAPHEIGIFVRSTPELDRAKAAATAAALPARILDENIEITSGHASIATMHLAKGLEFRAVAVMACDDEVIPSQARIESAGDDSELEEIYNTERHLLYVACTRARDFLAKRTAPTFEVSKTSLERASGTATVQTRRLNRFSMERLTATTIERFMVSGRTSPALCGCEDALAARTRAYCEASRSYWYSGINQ